jgi:hypothetical protein
MNFPNEGLIREIFFLFNFINTALTPDKPDLYKPPLDSHPELVASCTEWPQKAIQERERKR